MITCSRLAIGGVYLTHRHESIGRSNYPSCHQAVTICNCFPFPSRFQLRPSPGKLSAARSIAFRVLFQASQASDVGSIPIARSMNPDDSVDLTRLSYLNSIKKRRILDGSWTVLDSIRRSLLGRIVEGPEPTA